MLLCCDMLCVSVCVCVCHCVCVCEPQAQATYEPKKQVTLKLPRFSYLCTNPWAAATFFFTENAMSKKPLQANGPTWRAISC